MLVVRDPETGVCRRYRCENRDYTVARQLRGSSNNVEYTLLNMIAATQMPELELFLRFYPIYNNLYQSLMHRTHLLTSKLYVQYNQRYKKRLDIQVHPRHHQFLCEIHHKLYVATLRPNRQTVQLKDVAGFLLQQTPERILYLINYIYEADKAGQYDMLQPAQVLYYPHPPVPVAQSTTKCKLGGNPPSPPIAPLAPLHQK